MREVDKGGRGGRQRREEDEGEEQISKRKAT